MSNRQAVNVVKGKQGFQETNKYEPDMALDLPRETLSSPLHGEDANDLRQRIDNSMRGAIVRCQVDPFSQSANTDLVVAAQLRVLSQNESLPVDESWNQGGRDLVVKSLLHGLPESDNYSPISSERREDIAEEMVHTGLDLYSRANSHGELPENDENTRDARFQAAALILGDSPDVADEMGRICDAEVAEGRDPIYLDRLSLYKQARVATCRRERCQSGCDC